MPISIAIAYLGGQHFTMEKPPYIVAIGASAGGLEALSAFFEHTPLDSVAYVIVPHLSAEFQSQMVEILSRHSTLEVIEAEEDMVVEVNKVYLIPNTKYMGIKEGKLFLLDKGGMAQPHMTIDAFFTSLASERKERSIGVVLSGVGTDGSRGAIAIENAGGVIMVQDPENAKFDGMPRSVLDAVDTTYIYNADSIPAAIQQYLESERETNEPSLTEEDLSEYVNLIKEHYPFDFTDYKIGTLERRIKRRMAHHNILTTSSFITFLKNSPFEIETLISDFLIGVTSFFRDPEAFAIIETQVLPKIMAQKPADELLKIWISCCATGEEAYSFAILVKEYLIRNKLERDVKIFATDINEIALKQAAKGVFSFNISKTVSAERISHFFDLGPDNYKIKPEIREMLIFARHDLTKNPPYCYVDLVSCRNMLIYIKPNLQRQILSKLSFGLRRNGYLFLGSSENIAVAAENFIEINAKWKIYQSTQSRGAIGLEGQLASSFPLHLNYYTEKKTTKPLSETKPTTFPGLSELLFKESEFSGVIIDRDGKVTKGFGELGPFLKQERFKFNIHELLPENLSLAFSASIERVLETGHRERLNNINYHAPNSGKNMVADLIVSPYFDKKIGDAGMLVLFKLSHEVQDTKGTDFHMGDQTREYIATIERQLTEANTRLEESSEYLISSKEAMQSFNEELLSANEELQSANEELQSINEELETVNNAHKQTIAQLTDLNDDLNNYFRSNLNGQLFVDKDILLKKYSPGAVKHINLRESDLGRPLSNITTNIKFETIIEDINNVISSGETVLKEIESNNGRLYQVMTSPYLKKNNKHPNGAIITFYDVTELKKTQHELDKSTKMLSLATVASGMGTWSVHIETLEFYCSDRLKEIFGFQTNMDLTLEMALLQIEPDHQLIVKNAINDAIVNSSKFEAEFPIIRKNDGTHCWLRAVGSRPNVSDPSSAYLTGIMQDVTDHKLDDIRKNDFIAIASHELKSPLTTMYGFLQLLLRKANDKEDRFTVATLEKTVGQAKKMEALISGFLNVSRLETGKIHLNRQSFEIDLLIKEVVSEITATDNSHEHKIVADCEVSVNADRIKIGQVINNLLTNAVKYSTAGTVIEISCHNNGNDVVVSVHDQGMGIDPDQLEKLFDRYYRVQNNETKTISGFGIGLYLSAEIIHRHRGKIWAESEPGKGSTFCFTIPAFDEKEE